MDQSLLIPELVAYMEETVLPQYQDYEPAHDISHIRTVIENSFRIAAPYDVDVNMVYAIACYHDLGIRFGRDDHHLTSAKLLLEDQTIQKFFSSEQIVVMKQAIEDHRASSKNPPRSIYGKIVAEADRDLNPRRVISRAIAFAKAHHPNASEEEILSISLNHLSEKYGEGGYLTLVLDDPVNVAGLKALREMLADGHAKEIAIEELHALIG